MKFFRTPQLLATALFLTVLRVSGEPGPTTATALNVPVGEPFAPDLTKPLGSEWKVVKGTWIAEAGELHGDEVPSDKHSAVLWHPGKIGALIISCEFQLGKAGAFYTGFDADKHVGRLVVRAGAIGLYEDSPDPNLKPGEKSKSHPLATFEKKLKPDEWYPLTLEIRGDEMAALVAGVLLKAQHAFLATPKERFWFAVGGTGLRIRNLKVWDAKANPGWPDLKARFGK